jgi:hypothetical protein
MGCSEEEEEEEEEEEVVSHLHVLCLEHLRG